MAADRRLFFLLIRALGVYCLVEGLRAGVEALQIDLDSGLLVDTWMQIWCAHLPGYCAAVVLLGVGGYLLFGGRRLLDYVAPAREGRCWDCNYDLMGNQSGRCSECGRPIQALPTTPARPGRSAQDPPWFRGSTWARRVILSFVVLYLASCLLSAILRRLDVIICEPNSGRFCFAGP